MEMNPIDKWVASRLRSARNLANMSQEQAGDVLGISFQQIQKLERGVNRLSIGRLIVLLHAYRQPLEYVLSGAPMPGQVETSPAGDPGTDLVALQGGADLAHTLIKLTPANRRVVAIVAEALR